MQDDLGSCYVCVDKECRWKWRFSTEASTNGWNCLRGVAPLSNLLGLVHELQYDDGLAGIGQGAQEQRFATKPTLQGFAGARWVLPAVVGESQKARPESYADLSFGAWLSGNSGVRGAKMAERVRTRGGGVDVARCPYVYVYYTSRPVLPVLPYCRTAILPHTQHHTSTIGYFRWSVLERGCLCAHSSIHSIRYIHPPAPRNRFWLLGPRCGGARRSRLICCRGSAVERGPHMVHVPKHGIHGAPLAFHSLSHLSFANRAAR